MAEAGRAGRKAELASPCRELLRVKRRLRRERRYGRARGGPVFAVKRRRERVLVGFSRGYVSFLAVTRPNVKRRLALRYIRRAP